MLMILANTGRWIAAGTALSLALHYAVLLSTCRRTAGSAVVQAAAALAYGVSAYITVALLAAMAAHEQLISDAAILPPEDSNYVRQYALWAPLLLLQWGALDGITAYSVEDAEIWRRHAVAGLVQFSLAVFVALHSLSKDHVGHSGGGVLCSAAVLAVAGIKCVERVVALRTASRSVLSRSCLAIYEFMRLEAWLQPPLRGQSSAAHGQAPDGPIRYHYPVSGELLWYHRFLLLADDTTPEEEDDSRCLDAARRTPELVTLHDLYSAPELSDSRRLLLTCVAFSMFKLFRRRLAGLYMYEWRQKWKTPHFFLSGQMIRRDSELLSVLDMELSFLCDSIYTKFATLLGPAAAAGGRMLAYGRLLTTALLTASAAALVMDVRRSFQSDLVVSTGAAQAVDVTEAVLLTWLLMASAISVEAYQLICLAFSDWFQVWLACSFIKIKDMVQDVDDRLQRSVEDDMNRADPYWVDGGGDSHDAAVPIITEEFRRRRPLSTGAGIRRMKLRTQRWIGRCAGKLILSTASRLSNSRLGCTSGASRFCSRIGQSSLMISWDRSTNSDGACRRIWRRCRSSTSASYVDDPVVVDEFRQFVVRRVTEWCKEQYFYRAEEEEKEEEEEANGRIQLEAAADVQNCAAFSSRWVWRVYTRMAANHRPCLIAALGDSYTDFDHLLINWHIATSICHILEAGEGGTTDSNVEATVLVTGDGNRRRRADVVAVGTRTAELQAAVEVDVSSDGCESSRSGDEVVAAPPADVEQVRRVGKMLSEYMVFLLVHETELLPCHAEVARGVTEEVRRALRRVPLEAASLRRLVVGWEERESCRRRRSSGGGGGGGGVAWRLAAGMEAARRLMEVKEEGERWEVIVGVWVELLISAAASTRSETKEKAEMHLKRRRRSSGWSSYGGGGGGGGGGGHGGELITQLWLLLAHMGFAEMQL